MHGLGEEREANGRAEFTFEDIASNNAIMRIVDGLEGGAVGLDELGVGCRQSLGAAQEGGDEMFERYPATLDEDEVDPHEVAIAQRVFVKREGTIVDGMKFFRIGAVIHFGHFLGDVADGGEGVGEQVAWAVEVLENKLVEILRLGGGVALGVLNQGLGALGGGN